MTARTLEGHVTIVTGASRGVGKGIALALGSAGATVYVTGRTRRGSSTSRIPGTIDDTADEITARGGKGIAIACDHAKDDEVRALFDRVKKDHDCLDVLVNNAFAIPEGKLHGNFWELPLDQWDTVHRVGLRSHFTASYFAAPLMIARKNGLIVNVSSFGAKVYAVSVAYGVGKAGVDRMTHDMGRELAPHNITVVSLWPGVVKTERLQIEPERLGYDPKGGESAEFTGRAVVALAADADRKRHNERAHVVAELAELYGFTDVDGSRPKSLRKRD